MTSPSQAELAAFWADEPVVFDPPQGQEGPQERLGASGRARTGPDAEGRREAHTAGSDVERCDWCEAQEGKPRPDPMKEGKP